jgi:hypothetical protein
MESKRMTTYSIFKRLDPRFGQRDWLTFFVFVLALLACGISFTSEDFDWDLDHELYFGQRFFLGELIWQTEFHDKLPFVQIIMSIPGGLGSPLIWKTMSLVSILGAAFAIRSLLPKIFSSSLPTLEISQRDFTRVALIYLFASNYQLGGLTQINAMATSLSIIAVLLLFRSRLAISQGPVLFSSLVVSAICSAAAVSIRPYLAGPIFVGAVWFILGKASFDNKGFSPNLAWRLGFWVLLAALFTAAFNLGPYVLVGEAQTFWEGIGVLKDTLNPQPAFQTFFPFGVLSVLLISAIAVSFTAAKVLKLSPAIVSWLLYLLFSSLALLAVIFSRHWWPHYLDMFTGIAAIFLVLVLVALQEIPKGIGKRLANLIGALLVVAMIFVVLLSQKTSLALFGSTSNNESTLDAINLLRVSSPTSMSFIAPEDMTIHWQARESRHGFPHAAHTYQMLSGWWAGLDPSPIPNLPSSLNGYCSLIELSNIDYVLLSENSLLNSCFLDKGGGYVLHDVIFSHTSQIYVYSKELGPE